jgi:hypothetical protein
MVDTAPSCRSRRKARNRPAVSPIGGPLALDERTNGENLTMKNDNQAALDLFSNYSEFMLTDDELLAIHGGDSPAGAPATSSPASAPSAPPAAPSPSPPADSGLATHAGHVATITGAGATAGGAIGGTLGISGGPAGVGAGAAAGGAIGGTIGFVIGVGNEIYEHRQVVGDFGRGVADTANGVAEFYATADVG